MYIFFKILFVLAFIPLNGRYGLSAAKRNENQQRQQNLFKSHLFLLLKVDEYSNVPLLYLYDTPIF